MQRVLARVADRAVTLMGKSGSRRCGLGHPGFCGGGEVELVAGTEPAAGHLDRSRRRRGFLGHARNHVLDRLKRRDPASELRSLADVAQRHVEGGMERAHYGRGFECGVKSESALRHSLTAARCPLRREAANRFGGEIASQRAGERFICRNGRTVAADDENVIDCPSDRRRRNRERDRLRAQLNFDARFPKPAVGDQSLDEWNCAASRTKALSNLHSGVHRIAGAAEILWQQEPIDAGLFDQRPRDMSQAPAGEGAGSLKIRSAVSARIVVSSFMAIASTQAQRSCENTAQDLRCSAAQRE